MDATIWLLESDRIAHRFRAAVTEAAGRGGAVGLRLQPVCLLYRPPCAGGTALTPEQAAEYPGPEFDSDALLCRYRWGRDEGGLYFLLYDTAETLRAKAAFAAEAGLSPIIRSRTAKKPPAEREAF